MAGDNNRNCCGYSFMHLIIKNDDLRPPVVLVTFKVQIRTIGGQFCLYSND